MRVGPLGGTNFCEEGGPRQAWVHHKHTHTRTRAAAASYHYIPGQVQIWVRPGPASIYLFIQIFFKKNNSF